ncbi:CheR family methyltransferase [Cellvibrio fibrivorans]|uniref:Chemotaxis protein methyltransferase n=1 Tax=Cellvibrio fibrivorans TaxID=126350 RepID=A0ABU1V2L4_9GAMM|nr:CheR family methyltransferase [Cellvibrio fibrivorans]MDR7091558.1 chemotaxis protein methyltransferase CheR [Cellvibrio fibrivorans]
MEMDSATPIPSDKEFQLFQQLIQDKLGIFLPAQKKALLSNRLWKRLQACQVKGFGDYYRLIQSPQGKGELNIALELITTNETYFFREQKHFDYLQEEILPKLRPGTNFRVWSAASSTGEEPYSIAMVLRDRCPSEWELLCSDVNRTVVEQAKIGIYPDVRVKNIPPEYLRRFCRKGVGPQQGNVRVTAELRDAVQFFTLNLHEDFPDIGKFDLVFLRNVLIYFENDNKSKILERIADKLNPGGILFVGHSESLHGISTRFTPVKPAIYRLAGR